MKAATEEWVGKYGLSTRYYWMKTRDVEKVIRADGWYRIKSKGHRQYKHPTKPGRVTIPWHKNGNEDLNLKTLASIEQQSGVKLIR